MKQLLLDIARAPAPTLDNFVPGRNGELVVALYALANDASHERFVYLWGSAGCGRSHLLRAVADLARSNGRGTACYDAAETAFDAGGDTFAVADDVHKAAEAPQVALFNLYNRIHGGGGVLLTSGDAAPAQLCLRADLRTRLAAGLVYQVHGLNEEEKAAALRGHAEARGFHLSDEVTAYLLRHAQRDLPSLLALLDALDTYSLETKRAVTVPLLRELLNG
jgi:DnaA family protein